MFDAGLAIIINPQMAAAGCLGGLVRAFRLKKARPWEIVGYIVSGALAANFIAPQVLRMSTIFPPMFISFGIGLSGKHLCFVLEKFFDKLLDAFGRTRNE